MFVSIYDNDDDGNENRICFWLRLDAWHLRDAAMVLVDIDPDGSSEKKRGQGFKCIKTFNEGFCPNIDFSENDEEIFLDYEMEKSYKESLKRHAIYQRKYDDMCRILYNLDDIEYDKPSYWIERAIAKKVNIPWLEFAIRKGFYNPKNEDINHKKDKELNIRTENNYLRLIFALANDVPGFNPNKPYESAKLIIDQTEIGLSQDTVASYISRAFELHSREKG